MNNDDSNSINNNNSKDSKSEITDIPDPKQVTGLPLQHRPPNFYRNIKLVIVGDDGVGTNFHRKILVST